MTDHQFSAEARQKRQFMVEVTMPSGEKLPTIPIDGDAFMMHKSSDVGYEIGRLVGQLIEQRLKA